MGNTITASETPSQTIEVSSFMPTALRSVFGLGGLFIMWIVTHDLGPALWPITIVTPFFGGLWLISVSIGAILVYGMIWGPNERWIIEAGQLSIIYELRDFQRSRIYPHTVFARTKVESQSWDSGPDTYSLRLTFIDGRTLKSPSFTHEADARAALAKLVNN